MRCEGCGNHEFACGCPSDPEDEALWFELSRRHGARLVSGERWSGADALTMLHRHTQAGTRLPRLAYCWMWGWHADRVKALQKRYRDEPFDGLMQRLLNAGSEPHD